MTIVLSVFGLTLLVGLLTTGGLSDRLGRRPVAAPSLLLLAGANR